LWFSRMEIVNHFQEHILCLPKTIWRKTVKWHQRRVLGQLWHKLAQVCFKSRLLNIKSGVAYRMVGKRWMKWKFSDDKRHTPCGCSLCDGSQTSGGVRCTSPESDSRFFCPWCMHALHLCRSDWLI
jgi:hypothetical protein